MLLRLDGDHEKSSSFVSTCSTWFPAENGDSLHLLEAQVTPGDFQGKNVDSEYLPLPPVSRLSDAVLLAEALLVCVSAQTKI